MPDFLERIDHLIDQVGDGIMSAEVVVDQVYAKYQELREDLVLHGGGRHHYTRDSLYEHLDELMQMWADNLLTPDGSDIKHAAEKIAEALASGVYRNAPFEFGDLKGSAHPTAYDNGAVIYDRPPAVGRLTEQQLRNKGHLHRLGLGNRSGDDLAEALGATS